MPSRLRTAAGIAGVIVLAVIAFATLSPLNLRPETGEPANLERFAAFAALSGAFVLARPQRWLWILLLTIAVAALLEAAQNMLPDRHGRLIDFAVKAMGAGVGLLAGLCVDRLASLCLRAWGRRAP